MSGGSCYKDGGAGSGAEDPSLSSKIKIVSFGQSRCNSSQMAAPDTFLNVESSLVSHCTNNNNHNNNNNNSN